MKNLIFSIYVPITERSIRTNTYFEDGGVSKSQTTKTQFEKYKHKLIEVKRQYAEQCGADFVLIEHVDQQFFNDEFDSINFYKHHLIEKFCNDYDNILSECSSKHFRSLTQNQASNQNSTKTHSELL